jgi:hypothetical protein
LALAHHHNNKYVRVYSLSIDGIWSLSVGSVSAYVLVCVNYKGYDVARRDHENGFSTNPMLA